MRSLVRTLFRSSRPRFWTYLLGPYLIGALAGAASPQALASPLLWWFFAFFALPANLFIYGINDVFDGDTDAHNEKKRGYEQAAGANAWRLILSIVPLTLLGLAPAGLLPVGAQWGMAGFLFFGYFYSALPIRAKTIPFLDGIFNVLYVLPAVVGCYAAGGEGIAPLLLAAGWLWCMAMHAFSAIPDIAADRAAGLRTAATVLGARGTLRYCSALYLAAAILSFPSLGLVALAAGLVYQYMLWQAGHGFRDAAHHDHTAAQNELFEVYKRFPLINFGVGFGLAIATIAAKLGYWL